MFKGDTFSLHFQSSDVAKVKAAEKQFRNAAEFLVRFSATPIHFQYFGFGQE